MSCWQRPGVRLRGPGDYRLTPGLARTVNRLDSRPARRSEVEVAGYDLDDGEDNWPHDDVVMVADEEPSPSSYRNCCLNSARRGFDPTSG